MKEKIIVTILIVAMFTAFTLIAWNHFDKPVEVTCESHYENIGADVTNCY